MAEFLKAAFSALPSAASSPLSLSAYVIAILAWLIIAWRVKRNKQVLTHLEKLPENERLTVLELEMGMVHVQSGLTAEQWIKLKTQSYYFLGFAVICLTLVVVFVTAALTKSPSLLYYFLGFALICLILTCAFAINAFGKNFKAQRGPSADITLFQEEGEGPYPRQIQARLDAYHQLGRNQVMDEPKPAASELQTYQELNKYQVTDVTVIEGNDGSSGERLPYASDDCTLMYYYERLDKKIWIKPQMPYLDLLSEGGPIAGLHYWHSPFSWQFPKLSIKIVNNSDSTVLLSEAAIKVITSKINIEPVLVIKEDHYNVGHFRIFNEGWGQVIDPIITFKIIKANRDSALGYNEYDEEKSQEQTVRVNTFDETTNISIMDDIPESLSADSWVAVSGNIQYHTKNREKRAIKFRTTVSLVRRFGLPRPPAYLYDLFLKAGLSGYTKQLPISQEIKPGESDHFLIRVASDKSALFNLAFSFRATGGMEIHSDEIILDMFVPRSQLRLVKAKSPGEFEREK